MSIINLIGFNHYLISEKLCSPYGQKYILNFNMVIRMQIKGLKKILVSIGKGVGKLPNGNILHILDFRIWWNRNLKFHAWIR